MQNSQGAIPPRRQQLLPSAVQLQEISGPLPVKAQRPTHTFTLDTVMLIFAVTILELRLAPALATL